MRLAFSRFPTLDEIGTFAMVRLDTKARPVQDGSIVFARYGNHYFLRQLDAPGSRSSFQCLQTRQETSIAHQAGSNNATWWP